MQSLYWGDLGLIVRNDAILRQYYTLSGILSRATGVAQDSR